MDKPCCVGVVRDSTNLKGEMIADIGGAPAYFTAPPGDAKTTGVLVLHDIFGFSIPNAKYIVDHFAGAGFPSIMGDFFVDTPSSLPNWPADETEIKEELGTPSFFKWWGEITSEAYWEVFHPRVTACVDYLKTKGCTKFCVIGFCWGGIAIEELGKTGVFSQGASCHGCHSGTDKFKAAKEKGLTISYHTVPGDDFFKVDVQEALKAEGAVVASYEGMYHGFVVRGDFAGNPALKEASEKCLGDIVAQFSAA